MASMQEIGKSNRKTQGSRIILHFNILTVIKDFLIKAVITHSG